LFEKITADADRKCYTPYEKKPGSLYYLHYKIERKMTAEINTGVKISKKPSIGYCCVN
jgi:hypothetical protein